MTVHSYKESKEIITNKPNLDIIYVTSVRWNRQHREDNRSVCKGDRVSSRTPR